MITILRRRVARNIWVTTFKVRVTTSPCSKIMFGLYNLVIWTQILKLFHRLMITILRWCVACNICVTTWRSMSQHDLAAKSCLAHNFVIWSRMLKLFSQKWSQYWDNEISCLCPKPIRGASAGLTGSCFFCCYTIMFTEKSLLWLSHRSLSYFWMSLIYLDQVTNVGCPQKLQ